MNAAENPFLALTRMHFTYLETEYDLSIVEYAANELGGGRIVYQNAHTGVRVRYYDGPIDLYVELGRLIDGQLPDMPRLYLAGTPVNVLRIRQIVRNRAPADTIDVGLWRKNTLASTADTLDPLLSYHARVLREHAGDVLQGDFAILEEVGDNIRGKYAFGRQIRHYFRFLFDEYAYAITQQEYVPQFSGCAAVTLESPEYVIRFILDGKGVEVTASIQHRDGPAIDLKDIFRFLTDDLTTSRATLYYFPHFTLRITGDESSDWQVRRLAAILRPMWHRVQETAHPLSAAHHAFQTFEAERRRRYADAVTRPLDGYRYPPSTSASRGVLSFEPLVHGIFGVLADEHGYECVHSDPIFVRYETSSEPRIFINVFHTLHRYRVGMHAGLVQSDPHYESHYSLEEFAGLRGVRLEKWPLVARTTAALHEAVESLARQFRQVCPAVLAHDAVIFHRLRRRRVRATLRVTDTWTERNAAK